MQQNHFSDLPNDLTDVESNFLEGILKNKKEYGQYIDIYMQK